MINWNNNKLWLLCILTAFVLPSMSLAHNLHDNTINRIEPLSHIKYEIEPRSRQFFEKRYQSAAAAVHFSDPKQIEYDDHFKLTLNAYNTTFHLNLEPNFDLFHPDAVIYYHESGNIQKMASMSPKNRIGVFKGHLVTTTSTDKGETAADLYLDGGGWARILIRNDLMLDHEPIIEGAFSYHGDIYHIKSTSNYNLVKRLNDPLLQHNSSKMIIYRDSDMSLTKRRQDTQQYQCGFDNLLQQPQQLNNKRRTTGVGGGGGLFNKRSDDGCPKTKKINYMGAAADCSYVQYYKSRDIARIQIINDFNLASAVFEETFNVALGLINITIMDTTCPTTTTTVNTTKRAPWNRGCDANYSLGDRLSDFSQWRSGMSNDGAGLWHLMTNCPTGVEIGLAWLKQLCNTGAFVQSSSDGKQQYVSGAGVSAITRDEWKVVAHEIGHSFGAIHDCTSDSCPCEGDNCQCCPMSSNTCSSQNSFLMSPISNTSAENFSPCSINTICSAFPSIGTCLSDPQQHLRSVYQLNVCGNGIKEEGEECDTGGVDSGCCDAKTCKLKKPAAVCEDKNDSCCHQCQIRPKTHMCRPAANPCDISEYCTDDSPTCPDDVYVKDGVSCGLLDGLKCASGQCTSRDEQCLSRGFVMNITKSCLTNNEECKMLCNTPDSDKCLLFSGNFIDGTPCGYGGRCFDGHCQNGGPVGSSMLWMKEHQKIEIPVCIIAFLIACIAGYLIFWFGCCWRCTGYKGKKKKNKLPMYSSSSNNTQLPRYDDPDRPNDDDAPPPPYHHNMKDGRRQQQQKRNSNNSVESSTTASSSSSSLTVVVNNNNVDEKMIKTEKNE